MVIKIQIEFPEIPKTELREQRMAALLARATNQVDSPMDYIDDLYLCGICLQPIGYDYADTNAFLQETFAHLSGCICDSCWNEYNDRLAALLPPEQTN